MMTLETTAQFRRDYKRAKKRGYNMKLLGDVIDTLLSDVPLEPRHRDHQLTGSMKDYRECHIQPDWLLMYRIEKERLVLVANRTGTHSDLFDE
ncbi:MAG: type II toxin-antitoxin system YafQ family toxin [Clostridia bacterium]|nr:type II toxin-antitoxin system YafQ family toxin [Clostridia bacterium]